HSVGDGCELCLWLQPVGLLVVEPRAVDIQCSRDVTVGLGSRVLLLAEEIRFRPRIDECSTAFPFNRLDIDGPSRDAVIDGCGETFRRRRLDPAFERQTCLPPGSYAAIEDRNILHTDVFQRPISTRS